MKKKMSHKLAFTFVETLITLVVIGVVAALCIPVIISFVNKEIFVSGLKKEYSTFYQATLNMKNDNGNSLVDVTQWARNEGEVLQSYSKYLHFLKLCSNTSGCWHEANQWYDLNGNPDDWEASGYGTGVLEDGSLVLYQAIGDNSCTNTKYTDSKGNGITCGEIYIDVNGFKPPNTKGRDIFEFFITQNGLVPNGTNDQASWDLYCSLKYNYFPQNGDLCAAKVLNENAMNY